MRSLSRLLTLRSTAEMARQKVVEVNRQKWLIDSSINKNPGKKKKDRKVIRRTNSSSLLKMTQRTMMPLNSVKATGLGRNS